MSAWTIKNKAAGSRGHAIEVRPSHETAQTSFGGKPGQADDTL